ncbi:Membrane protein involved in aromatic hydrocarbon degradation [Candidatus Magnetoovum chiemensis]|nr:Membrane protein involved in aromatic hydrocarbon degradation [Candidatus Magnetoovum chiemensis]
MLGQNGYLLKRFILFFLLLSILNTMVLSKKSAAQLTEQLEIPSSPNPVGSGARALGMGGAFIAIADDATAASWNPGGLIQLETPEMSVVGAFYNRGENLSFGANPEANGPQDVSKIHLNYLSFSYPFKLFGINIVTSVNYQNLYDFGRQWNFSYKQDIADITSIDYDQSGALSAVGIALCGQIAQNLSFGVTFNFWEDIMSNNAWQQYTRTITNGQGVLGDIFNMQLTKKDYFSFSGFNANVGLLWDITGKLTTGIVFKTPFRAKLTHELIREQSIIYPNEPTGNIDSIESYEYHERLDMPMSYGIGLAYRFSDNLTIAADLYRTHWNDFWLIDSNGKKTSPISGLDKDESNISAAMQTRIGAEYLFITRKYIIPLRAGLFYDPAPAEDEPDDYYGLTLGSGVGYKRFVFDMAYQYRFGNDVGTSFLPNLQFAQNLNEHLLYSSLIIHF